MEYSNYEKAVLTITGPLNKQLLGFTTFYLFQHSNDFYQKFYEKLPGFKINFESTDKVLLLHQYL